MKQIYAPLDLCHTQKLTIALIIGGNDLLIASHALCEQATLVTNNYSEFQRVPKLIIENWGESNL